MSLRLWYSDALGAGWQELDLAAAGAARFQLEVSYAHSARLSFTLHVPQHAPPIPDRAMILFLDTNYSSSVALPVFEGHVARIAPRSSHEVEYTCLDSMHRARNEITILSGPHGEANVIPRLVYNSKIDNDDDRAFELRHDASVGRMIEDLLTFAYNELVTLCQAAPPATIGGDAFVASDLAPFDFIPQEKVVFESETLGVGLDRLLRFYPAYRVAFHPGQHALGRKWRFLQPSASPAVTLTLNDFSPDARHVLAMSLSRRLDGCFTAVRIYGPQQTVVETLYQEDDSRTSSVEGGLTKLWSFQQELNFRQLGPYGRAEFIGDAGKRWQITDPLKRRMSRILPHEVLITSSEFNVAGTSLLYKRCRRPTFQVTFDQGRNWWTVNGVTLDVLHGIISVPYHLHQFAPLPESSSASASPGSLDPDEIGNYRVPDNARFTFAYFDEPLAVRYPPSGYEGTAYDLAAVAVERRVYDEMLAVGYETGVVATTPERLRQFEKLAQEIHRTTKDVVHTGGCVIEGIDYEFLRLDRRVNFAAVDANGQTMETGWEAIGAIVSEVEYDYGEQTTTLTFSNDQIGFAHKDPDRLKDLLKIRAQEVLAIWRSRVAMDADRRLSFDFHVEPLVVEANL